MRAINEAIEGAAAFTDLLDKIGARNAEEIGRLRAEADRGGSLHYEPGPADRQPGENRAAHRARLRAERRRVAKVKP